MFQSVLFFYRKYDSQIVFMVNIYMVPISDFYRVFFLTIRLRLHQYSLLVSYTRLCLYYLGVCHLLVCVFLILSLLFHN
jgi:hypothetical protein